jgi:transcriptional regulator with XRE-family HTH domain
MEANTLKERVKKFLESERISHSQFAKDAGVSDAYVNSIKKNMSFEMLKKLHDVNPRVSIAWLLWGVGEMYNNNASTLKSLQDENAILREKVTYLQKIVELYERNENAKK